MRNLFLMLVLANLAFAAWHAWFSAPPRVGETFDPDLPSLTLVSEVPDDLRSAGVVSETEQPLESAIPSIGVSETAVEQPSADTAAAAIVTESAPLPTETEAVERGFATLSASGRCTSVGPFRELAQAATATANLRAAGYQPLQRVAEGDIWIGYWVYIPAIPTLAEANEILARVREQGIEDSYVIPNSDSGNLVSLGVFSEISGVSRRRDQVRGLGFEPQVVDRTRRATVYWVDVQLTPEQTLDFDSLQTPGRIVRLEQRPCEAATG